MTTLHWILTGWAIGTTISTIIDIYKWVDDDLQEYVHEKVGPTPQSFVRFVFYAITFFDNLLLWPRNLFMTGLKWLQMKAVIILVNKMLKLLEQGKGKEAMKVVKLIEKIKKPNAKEEVESGTSGITDEE